MNKKDWYCYMVRCRDDSFYVGMSNDLAERIKEHNWGVKSEFTTKRRPVVLVWSEQQPDRNTARKREKEIKGWRREKKLKLIHEYECRGPQSACEANPSPSARGKGE
ncbi:MAG: GIY-YIG nuclease family protein [Acidobacteria bacterium]|nr:GIY-YIG nuclease family protein [Acidobacteriota bacterium]MBI3662786.1 GIY-YIG nuclease family protein [Acidobacteriota bacterium]